MKKGIDTMENFRERFEKNRKRLHELVEEKGFNHPEVIQLSKLMDQMLNEYGDLMNNEEETSESVPLAHIRITPTGFEYEISLQEGLKSTHISNAKDLEQAKQAAKDYVKTNNTNLKIYYLEQLIK